MKYFLTTFIFSFIILTSGFLFGQRVDFNNYETLKAKGDIPVDFSTRTYDKIKEEIETGRTDISKKANEKIFIQKINSSIDEILHSGYVVYGDDVTKYVSKVGEKVLKSLPELQNKLRFYTLKSNIANAFSTDQGIVFVTTGLISQLENEAQLAFVLAHEISHYTEHHVVETYEYNIKNRFSLNIEQLSIYSKDKEFEADKLGVKLYHDAGYSKSEIAPGFDVLLYSYLPFDEIEFPKNYFNSDLIYVPTNLFPDKKYEIKAEDDVDDSKSSHPNIKSRKIKTEEEINTFNNWGEDLYLVSKEDFEYIRNICRFESIRTDIIDHEYADALYTIFILEKTNPNSMYLQRRKAQIWLSISQLQNAGLESYYTDRSSEYEGEIASLHFFLKKLDKISTSALAMRNIQDISNRFPEDKEIMEIRKRMIRSLAYSEKFKLEDFSEKTFQQAYVDFQKAKIIDTTVVVVENKEEKLSKYDKIRRKKDVDNPNNFDSTYYYKYALSDLVVDEKFKETYIKFQTEKELEDQKKDITKDMSNRERKKYYKQETENEMKIGLKSAILFDPYVNHYNKNGTDIEKSEDIRVKYLEALDNTLAESEVKLQPVARYNLDQTGTKGFNDRALILTYFRQNELLSSIDDIFPVDYSDFNDLKKDYNTNYLVFASLEHSFSFDASFALAYAILFPPALFIVLPIKFMRMHHTEMSFIVFNLDDPTKSQVQSFYFRDAPSKLNIEARLFNIFEDFSQTPQ